uniref:Uncharacterized protein n=1 Tax=Aegilops tauschii subsp. strangulata TaxID=200361 RepID=A0A453P4C6_AEGTS
PTADFFSSSHHLCLTQKTGANKTARKKTVNEAHQISICFISQTTPQPREEPPPPPGNERSRRLQVTAALALASIPSPPSRLRIPGMPPIRDEPPPPRNETSRRL